jgi:hypothetical protein
VPAGMVRTKMTEGMGNPERMIQVGPIRLHDDMMSEVSFAKHKQAAGCFVLLLDADATQPVGSFSNISNCHAMVVLQAEDVAEAVMLAVKTKQVGGTRPLRTCHVMLPVVPSFDGVTTILHLAYLQSCTPVDVTLRPTEPAT